MLGSNVPNIVSEDDRPLYLDRIMQLKLELSDRLSHDEIVDPLFDFQPISPFNAKTLSQDQRTHLKEWSQGYLSAIALRRKHWQSLKDVQNLELTLQVIANETQATQIIGLNSNNLNQRQIQTLIDQMIDSLPVLLGMMYDQSCEIAHPPKAHHKHKKTDVNLLFSQEKVKRQWQVPCPCGSTQPFAQCCALSRETRH